MKIENLKSDRKGSRARVSATVKWEDCPREDYELFFETEEAFAGDLTSNPNAFLIAGAIPALHYGEKRVFIDAEVCPDLRDGLNVALGWLSHWYGQPRPRLEDKGSILAKRERPAERAGFFFSGGIDSFATLRRNRLTFPPDHPRYIRDGILIFGLEQDIPEIFELVRDSLSEAAREVDVNLIPVYTNLYLPFREEDSQHHWDLWQYRFMGGALASVAHAFAKRFNTVSISPDFDIPNFHPNGSHPLLEPNYSSMDLRIRYDGTDLSRFDRTKLIADWGPALSHLRVCNQFKQYEQDRFNCGKCEKCIRTMLAFVALGVLDKSRSFQADDVTEEMMSEISIERMTFFYHELIEPLRENGRPDLAAAIEEKLRNPGKGHKKSSLKSKIKDLDERYFHGEISRFVRK